MTGNYQNGHEPIINVNTITTGKIESNRNLPRTLRVFQHTFESLMRTSNRVLQSELLFNLVINKTASISKL